MIEVKNWTDEYAQSHKQDFSPYEQAGRAGLVLWITLKNMIKDIRVTNVLLSIRGNLQYNEKYRLVYVSSLDRINQFLEKRQDSLNEKEVEEIVNKLERYVTT